MRLPFKEIEGTPSQKVLANSPRIFKIMMQLDKALSDILPPEILEITRLRVAANNSCEY